MQVPIAAVGLMVALLLWSAAPASALQCGPVQCNVAHSMATCGAATACVCRAGWMGADCSADVNECAGATNPCPSGLVCHNRPGFYNCSVCAHWCANGECDATRALCVCALGFMGDTCEQDEDLPSFTTRAREFVTLQNLGMFLVGLMILLGVVFVILLRRNIEWVREKCACCKREGDDPLLGQPRNPASLPLTISMADRNSIRSQQAIQISQAVSAGPGGGAGLVAMSAGLAVPKPKKQQQQKTQQEIDADLFISS